VSRHSDELPGKLQICGDISDSRLDDHLPGHYSSLHAPTNDNFNNLLNFLFHGNEMSRRRHELPRELPICGNILNPGLNDSLSSICGANDDFCFDDLWYEPNYPYLLPEICYLFGWL
jgi:hypothetical protein